MATPARAKALRSPDQGGPGSHLPRAAMPQLIAPPETRPPSRLPAWRPLQAATRLLRLSLMYAAYARDFLDFYRLAGRDKGRLPCRWNDRLPVLVDRSATTSFDRHYIYHCAWAARVLAELRPAGHVDISSSLYFASIVSAFVPVDFYDFRPANIGLSGLRTGAADLTRLSFGDQSLASVSCMHVVEHIGLGRYGDPIDPDGDIKAMIELQRVIAPGGSLIFVVPVGRPRICFNAHRIYSYRQIREQFSGLQLARFALITDDGSSDGLVVDADESLADSQLYGCGCFWFRRTQ